MRKIAGQSQTWHQGAPPPPALLVFLQVAVTAYRKERFKRVPYGIGDGAPRAPGCAAKADATGLGRGFLPHGAAPVALIINRLTHEEVSS
jgi:hypothetical protein